VKRYEFHLSISPGQYEDYYRGTVRHVLARSTAGERVQFPASLLQRFISKDGIHGAFSLTCSDDCKAPTLEKLKD
jgi:hypothetical protein